MDGKSFAFPPLSPAAQELIVAGGAENLVATRLVEKLGLPAEATGITRYRMSILRLTCRHHIRESASDLRLNLSDKVPSYGQIQNRLDAR